MFMYTDYNQHLLDNVKKIHFIGCGGSGMYPLIQILAAKGYQISGSDVLDGSIIRYGAGDGRQGHVWATVQTMSSAPIWWFIPPLFPRITWS